MNTLRFIKGHLCLRSEHTSYFCKSIIFENYHDISVFILNFNHESLSWRSGIVFDNANRLEPKRARSSKALSRVFPVSPRLIAWHMPSALINRLWNLQFPRKILGIYDQAAHFSNQLLYPPASAHIIFFPCEFIAHIKHVRFK